MPVQPASSVLLSYGPQGARQNGSTVLLNYAAAPGAGLRLTAQAAFPWGGAATLRREMRAPSAPATHRVVQRAARWVAGRSLRAAAENQWPSALHANGRALARWADIGRSLRAQRQAAWPRALAALQEARVPWSGPLAALLAQQAGVWPAAFSAARSNAAPWGGPMRALHRALGALVPAAVRVDVPRWVVWLRYSRPLAPGWGVVIPENPDAGSEPLYTILPARVYMQAHDISARRVADGVALPIFSADLAADFWSFCWNGSISGPAELFDLCAPVADLPPLLAVLIDGVEVRFMAEQRRREQAFGRTRVTVSGRSTTALVGAPWRAATTRAAAADRTAQQLALEALDLLGVNLAWEITDWLVPGGVWSHQGTPLGAVQAIAEAAGAAVLSHRTDATLIVRHPYPVAPWGWAAAPPDVEIAPDALVTVSSAEEGGQALTGVYVTGTSAGVVGFVKRTGTAGDALAPMVTNPLITHADAARQRGLAILGATGRKRGVQIEMPLLTGSGQPGLLEPGQLVRVSATTPWTARVRGVRLSAALPRVRQAVTLEQHLSA